MPAPHQSREHGSDTGRPRDVVGRAAAQAIDPDEWASGLGSPVLAVEPVPWGFSNRTALVTTIDGGRFAVQRFAEPILARARIETIAALQPRLAAAGVPAPAVVRSRCSDPRSLVTEWIDGRNGAELLGDGLDAIALGTEMGRLATRVASVDVGGLRLPGVWRDATRLGPLADRWLAALEPDIKVGRLSRPSASRFLDELRGLLSRVGPAFAGRPSALAHGDFAPINAIVRGRAVVGLVDWEHARLADPLLDVATWGWTVWHHHRPVWRAAWPAFLETAGVQLDQPTVERLRIIVALRLLEAAASPASRRNASRRAAWIGRLVEALLTEE